MKNIKQLPVVLLGLVFVAFSIQFFAMIVSGTIVMPPMNDMATQFMGVWFASGFVWVTKTLELVLGIMLLVPRTRNLALVMVAPLVVGIFLTEILIVRMGFTAMIPGILLVILNAIGLYQHRAAYLPMVRR